jgi:ABC-2 type transport system permease protein
VLIDGSESNTAGIGAGYLNNIINSFNMERVTELLARLGLPAAGVPPIDPAIRIWFNPLLESSTTIVPGLIGAIIVVVSALLTCLTVVRERENGSLEGLFATPVRKREI